jgi:hypothetical protein
MFCPQFGQKFEPSSSRTSAPQALQKTGMMILSLFFLVKGCFPGFSTYFTLAKSSTVFKLYLNQCPAGKADAATNA